MNAPKNKINKITRILSIATVMLIISGLSDTLAQPGGGGPRLEPADQKAAWELEAKGVARILELTQEVESKLVASSKMEGVIE